MLFYFTYHVIVIICVSFLHIFSHFSHGMVCIINPLVGFIGMPVVQIWEQLTMSVPVISRDLSRLPRVWTCQRKMRAGDAVNHTHEPLKWCWCLSQCDLGACWDRPAFQLTSQPKGHAKGYMIVHMMTASQCLHLHLCIWQILSSKATCIAFKVLYWFMLSLGIKLMLHCLSYRKFVYSIYSQIILLSHFSSISMFSFL